MDVIILVFLYSFCFLRFFSFLICVENLEFYNYLAKNAFAEKMCAHTKKVKKFIPFNIVDFTRLENVIKKINKILLIQLFIILGSRFSDSEISDLEDVSAGGGSGYHRRNRQLPMAGYAASDFGGSIAGMFNEIIYSNLKSSKVFMFDNYWTDKVLHFRESSY